MQNGDSAANVERRQADQLLTLHQGVGVVPVERFQQWTLELLASWFGCDYASWASGTDPRSQPHSRVEFGTAARRAKIAHLELQLPHLQRGFVSLITIQRGRTGSAFADLDARRFEMLAPHVMTAWQSSLRLGLHAFAAKAHTACAAIVNSAGYLELADSPFYEMLRNAWPNWNGSRLPEPLLAIAAGESSTSLANATWSVQVTGDLRFLVGTPLGPMSRLSSREQTVTRAVLDGASHAEVASQLGISANTARNTLARVYKKLSVRNRMELARRFRSLMSKQPST
jgi:DNA-binding CsgD family transcriptional regulator